MPQNTPAPLPAKGADKPLADPIGKMTAYSSVHADFISVHVIRYGLGRGIFEILDSYM